jgi:hypothetical protein
LPSPTPVPRGPSVLLLGSASALFGWPGCPACRYTAEASDAYLTWFALDGHYDADVLARLCASRGMCAPHTRRLLSQPGAPARLTAVYRYVIQAAARGFRARPAQCPACEHDAVAEERVLDLVLEEVLAGDGRTYKQHGGLCLPHLRRAASLRTNADVRWLARFMVTRLTAEPPGLDLLAGSPDPDADARAALRSGLPLRLAHTDAWACTVCWAAADAERNQLADARSASRPGSPRLPGDCLCRSHLHDYALAADNADDLLTWQAECQVVRLAQVIDGQPRLLGISVGWLSARARRAFAAPDCPTCRSAEQAAAAELGRVQAGLRAAGPGSRAGLALCVRHASRLHDVDARAGNLACTALSGYASKLLGELEDAFRKETWSHRGVVRGAEMTAWRRAAAFLDGAVFGGCPAA